MPRACSIRLLGGFGVTVDGRPIPPQAWRHRRAADLVKVLALAPGHRLHREQVMDALWPALEHSAAAANLRKAIHFARRALDGRDAIGVGPDMVELWPGGGLTVDIEGFEAAAQEALAAGVGTQTAVDLFTGELLPEDRYADWTEPRRERVREQCLELLRAVGGWERILEMDRTNEEAHRTLMRRQLESGNRQAAIRQFQRLREILRVDLGVGPDQETVALFERALATRGPQVTTHVERAQALIARGLLSWNRGEFDDAEQFAEQVRLLSSEHELGRELGEASALLGLVAWARGHWVDRFRIEFAEALHLTPLQSAFVLDAHLCLAESSLTSTDSASVAALARDLLRLAKGAASVHGEALASLLIGEAEFFSGRLEESHRWLAHAVDLFDSVASVSGRALALVRLAENAVAGHHRPEAERLLAQAGRLAEQSELAPHLVVRVFAAMIEAADGTEQQLTALEQAEQEVRPGEVCGPCSIGFYIGASIACARAGELARARRFLADAERLTGLWQGGPWRAAAWEARGSLRRAEGDDNQAAALLHEAAGLFAECGRPLDEARCRAAAVPLSQSAASSASKLLRG